MFFRFLQKSILKILLLVFKTIFYPMFTNSGLEAEFYFGAIVRCTKKYV